MLSEIASPNGDSAIKSRFLQFLSAKWTLQAIGVSAELGIADLLDGAPKTVEDLALLTNTNPDCLSRLLRAAASVGVFVEQPAGTFAMTPLAGLLRTEKTGSLRDLAMFFTSPITWRPYENTAYSVRTSKAGFERAFGTDAYAYLEEHPDDAALFNRAMTAYAQLECPAIVEAYDFSRFSRVVDVGGGEGHLLSSILKAFPQVRGVLFDTPKVVEDARALLEAQGVADRVERVGGDFFSSVPRGGDCYVIKRCLHNWSDELALQVLQTLRLATIRQETLLVIDPVIREGNDPSFAKLLDIEMMVLVGGRERTEAEWSNLLGKAHFRLTNIMETASPLAVIEAKPA